MQDSPASLTSPVEEPESPSLAQDLRQMAEEAKTFAQAELAFQKSRAAYIGTEIRTIAVLLVAALVLVFFAIVALVVGTVIALGPLLGPWGAMLAVTLLLLIAAVLGALNARSRLRRMMKITSSSQTT